MICQMQGAQRCRLAQPDTVKKLKREFRREGGWDDAAHTSHAGGGQVEKRRRRRQGLIGADDFHANGSRREAIATGALFRRERTGLGFRNLRLGRFFAALAAGGGDARVAFGALSRSIGANHAAPPLRKRQE